MKSKSPWSFFLLTLVLFVNRLEAQPVPQFSWAKHFQELPGTGIYPGDNKGVALALDPSGNVITTGSYSFLNDFDPGPGVATASSVTGSTYISKLDANGNFVWVRTINGMNSADHNFPTDVAVDAAGNTWVCGEFGGTVDFDPGPGTFTMSAAAYRVGYILKLDASGNFLWAGQLHSLDQNSPHSLAVDPSGNALITGHCSGTTDFDPGPATFTMTAAYTAFIMKLSPAGNFTWAKKIEYGNGHGIATDAAGNVYSTGATGHTGTPPDLDPGPGVYTLQIAPFASSDIYVQKLDANGNFVWAGLMGSTFGEEGRNICLDAGGNVFISGSFDHTGDFDPGPGTATLTATGGLYDDIFVVKLNSSGSFVWAKAISGPEHEETGAIAADLAGNVYLTGNFYDLVDFDPGPGTYGIYTGQARSIFIAKLSSAGNFDWAIKQQGGDGWGEDIVVDSQASIFTTGIFGDYSTLVDFDPGPGTYTVGTEGTFIWKLNPPASALHFDGVNDHVTRPAFTNTNVTLEARVKWEGPGATGKTIVYNGNASATGYGLYIAPNSSSLSVIVGGQATLNTTYVLTPNVWTQLSLVLEPSVIKVYANGILVYTGSGNATAPLIADVFAIGSNQAGTTNFNGAVDEVRLWSRALCQQEIASRMSCQPVSNEVGLVAAYNFNQGMDSGNNITVTTLEDATANTYTCQLNGFALTGSVSNWIYPAGTLSANCTPFVPPTPTITPSTVIFCAGTPVTLSVTAGSTYTWNNSATTNTIVITGSGTYSVAVTNPLGCLGIGKRIIQMVASPLPNITVNSGTVCQGSSFTLNPSGASTYTFEGGSDVVSPASSTTYTVIGKDYGCTSLPVTSTITVLPAPPISVNSGGICEGKSFTIVPTGASAYTVQGGSYVVSPNVTTTYTVGATGSNGCIAKVTSTVTLHPNPLLYAQPGIICQGQSFNLSPQGASTYTVTGGSTIVTPSVTTTYTITGTSAAGCVAQFPFVTTVTVNPAPNISVNSGSICSGQAFTLVPSGGTTYTVQGGNYVVSPTSSTTYTIRGKNALGCNSQTVATASITVNPRPSISVNSGSICSGQSFTMQPTGADSYTFQGGSAVVSPNSSTTYTVRGSSAAGCLSTNAPVSLVQVVQNPTVSVNSGSICSGGSFTIVPSGANAYTVQGGSFVVSPPATTAYTVIGSGYAGCVSLPVSSAVNVFPNPTLSVANGSVCTGESFTISPSGADTYTISGGSAVVSPASATSYTITGSNFSGCKATNTVVATVSVFTLPVLSVQSTQTLLCDGETATLTASGASSYQWDNGQSGSTLPVSPSANTSYTVTGTSSEGCSANSSISLVVSLCTAFGEIHKGEAALRIYPNPGSGSVYISGEAVTDLRVLNSLGQVVKCSQLSQDGLILLSIQDVTPGIYFVTGKASARSFTEKIVVQ